MKKVVLFLSLCITALGLYAQAPQAFQYQAVVRDGNGDIVPDQLVSFQISIISDSAVGTVEYVETHAVTTNSFGLVSMPVGMGTVVSGDIAVIDWGSASHFMKVEVDITGGSVYTDMGTVQLLSVPYALHAGSAANSFSGNYSDLTGVPDFTSWDQDVSNDFSGNYTDLTNKPVLAGDVTGQIESNTVTGIQGMEISTNLPANGQVLKWNNLSSTWEPSDDQLGAAGTTDGVVTGTSFTGTTTKTLTLIRSNGLGDITAVFTDLVDDADADPSNEIQILSLSGSDLTISGGNTVTLQGSSYSAGTGIDITGNTISNISPDQIVNLTGSGATTVSGTYPNYTVSSTDNNTTYSAGSGLALTGTTFSNAAPDQTVTLTGFGATTVTGTYPSFTITSTDNNNTYTAGSGINIDGSNQISNTLPDQTVVLNEGTGITVSGTYPNFTLTNSLPDQMVTLNTGSGISVSGTYPDYTIANSSPDQTVTITGSGATTVTGTYPSFTVSSTDDNTTYSAGTGLILTGTSFSHNAHSGDVTGTTALTVTGIQGRQVSSSMPGNNQILKWNTTNNKWELAEDELGAAGTNDGVVTSINVTGTTTKTITLTRSQSLSDLTATFTDEGSVYTAGTGIDVTGTVITNTSPDQTVTLTQSGATTITGTYPNFTISSTDNNTTYSAGTGLILAGTTFSHDAHGGDVNGTTNLTVTGLRGRTVSTTAPSSGQVLKYNGTSWAPASDDNTTYTAGTGLSLTGTQFANTSPDQTVTLTQGGATTITGTYPNFTISSTDNNSGGTVTSIATGNGITGGTITTTGTLGLTGQALALHNLSTNGIIVRTSAGNVSARTITGSTGISVTNGNGVSGNPTLTPVFGTTTGTIAEGTHTHTAYGAAGTNGMVQFNDNGNFGASANLFWDNTNTRLGVGTNAPAGMMVVKQSTTTPATEPLFEVRDKDGLQVFVVYEDSVMIYVSDDAAKTNKGAFAVSGRNTAKTPTNEYLRVSPDSVRVYIDEEFVASGETRGGFAVGGFSDAKTFDDNFFNIEAGVNPEVINPSEPRVLWYPAKEAFMAGRVLVQHVDSVGLNSWASGFESRSLGNYSQALGYRARAKGDNSTAIGNYANATSNSSFAMGDSAKASGIGSFAFGSRGLDTLTNAPTMMQTVAQAEHSFAFGFGSHANGVGSFAIGNEATSTGNYSVAIGLYDTTYAMHSYAFGLKSITYDKYTFAIGTYNENRGEGSFTFGSGNKTNNNGAFAMGTASVSTGSGSVAFGVEDTASGNAALSMGYRTKASGLAATAFGQGTEATNIVATAFGNNTTASGLMSTSFGTGTTASGSSSTAFGASTTASGANSTAFGSTTTASAQYATAMGYSTIASGINSLAIGREIEANGDYSFAIALNDQNGTIVSQDNAMVVLGGNVGIGTATPARPLHVISTTNGEPAARFRISADGTLMEFYSGVAMEGSISIAGLTTSYNAFTGSHYASVEDLTEKGLVMQLTGNNNYLNNNEQSEIIYGVKAANEANSPVILGAYLGKETFDKENSPHLVMAVGNGVMWVVDNGDNLKTGDYLISSSVSGHAMKDNGEFEIANIIARVAEPVDWNNVTTEINGVKHKLVSVFFENFKMYHYETRIQNLEKQVELINAKLGESASK